MTCCHFEQGVGGASLWYKFQTFSSLKIRLAKGLTRYLRMAPKARKNSFPPYVDVALFITSFVYSMSASSVLCRQLPFMKNSKCDAPSRSVTVLSCSFFGAPDPTRIWMAFLKFTATRNSSCPYQ